MVYIALETEMSERVSHKCNSMLKYNINTEREFSY
jgi:hypothetical protein